MPNRILKPSPFIPLSKSSTPRSRVLTGAVFTVRLLTIFALGFGSIRVAAMFVTCGEALMASTSAPQVLEDEDILSLIQKVDQLGRWNPEKEIQFSRAQWELLQNLRHYGRTFVADPESSEVARTLVVEIRELGGRMDMIDAFRVGPPEAPGAWAKPVSPTHSPSSLIYRPGQHYHEIAFLKPSPVTYQFQIHSLFQLQNHLQQKVRDASKVPSFMGRLLGQLKNRSEAARASRSAGAVDRVDLSAHNQF